MSTVAITRPDEPTELGRARLAAPAELAGIVARARKAQRAWASAPLSERCSLLEAAARALEPRVDELGDLLALESGKPLAQARFEAACAVGLLRGNAEEARRLGGRVLPTEGSGGTERDLAYTRRVPLGVVAAILPFNFPVELLVEKCGAALAAGNAAVAKLPLEDPLATLAFRDAIVEAGVPGDLFPAIVGDREVGAALAMAPGVDAISLTGSTAAGIAVASATASTLRRLHLELGGNNACIVLADADLELATAELLYGRLLMNGQACSASKRIVVERAVAAELAERLRERLARGAAGPAADPETRVGPLITPAAAERVAAQVRRAVEQGARLVAGSGAARGAYFEPCLLEDVPASADVAIDDEIFGPVFAVVPVGSAEEAIAVANASSFGLMGSVFSADLGRALAVAERLETGGVVINGSDNYRPPVIPFGGVKLSGTGREGLGFTLEELTREQTVVFRRLRRLGSLEAGS